jgi:GAF domain-containing protein
MISTGRMSDLLVEVADTLVDDFDLLDFLHLVTKNAAEITGSSAAGLMLVDHGGVLRPMAASTEDARLLELIQIQHAEGPCLDCFYTGQEVADIDVSSAPERWPDFGRRAIELGFRTAHCFPLRLREQVIGALNVFRDVPSYLDPEERRVARALTDIATIALVQERALRRAEQLTEQLEFALNSRAVIEQAKGALARVLGTGVDQAFVVLRGHSRHHGRKLTELARAVLEDPAELRAVARAAGGSVTPDVPR